MNVNQMNRKSLSGKIEVDEIILEGYSRGVIGACATARHLNKHNIPMHIIADQPVPGTSKYLKKDYSDMSECKNIRSATKESTATPDTPLKETKDPLHPSF